jgi:hypothetical protein
MHPQPPLLRLPPELRHQIYEHLLGHFVIYVRINWTGICQPAGFLYCFFDSLVPLLESSTRELLTKTVPLACDIFALSRVCQQMREETSNLPFKMHTWAFEDAFTLDQFVTTNGKIPVRCKESIRRVALPPPGPSRVNERVLKGLKEVLLIGFSMEMKGDGEGDEMSRVPRRELLRLKKDGKSDSWVRYG